MGVFWRCTGYPGRVKSQHSERGREEEGVGGLIAARGKGKGVFLEGGVLVGVGAGRGRRQHSPAPAACPDGPITRQPLS